MGCCRRNLYLRNFDFEDGARGCVRSRSRFCGGDGRESLADCLTFAISYEKENGRPSPQSSPRSRGEASYNRRVVGEI